ncbi:DUF4169 family protein [Sphingomonas alpina]|uniref:DUF4169 family protein n=1 Tax=Sphingomonas alpina TaxID=653931 RepID=A0A7H0LF56_9SPHN|nr:DUF4169 family protein [Sphingomonas alpina]QNQ08309.1 DUF4169 family protein [Sphingomonas alpina]
MADIVNLRAARKAQARASAATQADINRAAFGRTKAEKQKTDLEANRLQVGLDGAKLERD